jgi:amino acid transporter
MVIIVGIILFNTILNARQLHHSRFWTYEFPYGFSTKEFTARENPEIIIRGTLGSLASFWSAMTVTLFSLSGLDVILYTAPENQDLRRDETIKLATRKLSIRTILLYVLVVFTVGLNVPYDDERLRDTTLLGVPGGQNSALIIAAIREGVTGIPHFFNAFFIFAACSCGINCLYAASRALHALANIREVWPQYAVFESLRRRLATTRMGVPMNAVFVSWLVAFLAFLSVNSSQSETLGRMTVIAVVSNLLVYSVNCVAYLKFYKQINAAARGDLDEELNLTQEMRTYYNRSAPRYPYKTHLQWLRAAYALTGCLLFLIFQGWRTFLTPFSAKDFVASYIPIVLFLVLSAAYFVRRNGFRPGDWQPRAMGLTDFDTVGPILVSLESIEEPCGFCGAEHRRGYLRFADKEIFTRRNVCAFLEWFWTWLK